MTSGRKQILADREDFKRGLRAATSEGAVVSPIRYEGYGMCEANAYLVKEDMEQLIMESVDKVEPEESGLRLVNIFGEQKFVNARIHALSLVDHKILLRP